MKTALRTCAAWLCAAALCAGTASGQPAALSIDGKWQVWLDSVGATVRHPAGLPAGAVWAGQLRLPGSLQEQGYGDDIGTGTAWTGQIVDNSWYTAPEYAPYRKAGNVKVPFWLNPEKHYVGAAWYRRTVSVPEGWESRPVVLELERTHWVTDLYVDGRAVGRRTSLQTPHRYVLDGLEAGKHEILLRVDNHLHVDVGMNAHSVSDHTQTNWNGVVGRMSLVPKPAAYIGRVRTEPDIRRKAVRVDVRLEGRVPESGATLLLQAYTPQGKPVGKGKSLHVEADVPAGTVVTAYVPLGPDAQLWDEFSPAFYRLSATLQTGGEKDNRTVDFGLREFKTEGTRFTVNGRPVFLRGTLECCVFPLTGYPATDRACWEKIYRACQDHGLNHVRFHSWCPPEAAFHVADSMGMYLQVECGGWTEVGSNRPQDEWFREEAERILAEYGNHPSFCLMAYGNEPSGAMQESYLAGLVARWKAEDPRRVYTSAAGWPYIPEADFWSTMEPRIQVWGAGLGSVINREAPRTDYDFRSIIRRDMPTVSHEVGQWCVYPNFKEIKKYKGFLHAKNFEIFRQTLEEKGMGRMADDFLHASGRLQTLCYKADIEAAFRTPGFAGFQLLGLNDFPGQGTALVGVLDAFWESKGYADAAEYRTFCNATVPLARFRKLVWRNDETLECDVELAHFGPKPLRGATLRWTVADAGGRVLAERSSRMDVPLDNAVPAGRYTFALSGIRQPQQLVVSAALEGTPYRNSWHVWVYPAEKKAVEMPLVTDTLDERAAAELARGGKVLWLNYGKVPAGQKGDIAVGFSSIFWNTAWTRRQAPHTLGVCCRADHPALAAFPNEGVSDYQWWDLMSRCDALVLDSFPKKFKPIVYLVDDWFTNRKLGLLYEARVGEGRLLVCSADLVHDLENRPAAAQFRQSLLEYMASDRFRPRQRLTLDELRR